jgi:hypothetical protein
VRARVCLFIYYRDGVNTYIMVMGIGLS